MKDLSQDVAEELAKTAPEGVNVFWETARQPDFDLAVGALAERGRLAEGARDRRMRAHGVHALRHS